MKKIILPLFLMAILISYLNCHFSEANSVIPKLFPVEVKGKWGYINEEGKIVIKPQFRKATHFYEGIARVDKHIEISESEIEKAYRTLPEREARRQIKELEKNAGWYLINSRGSQVSKSMTNSSYPMSDGLILFNERSRGYSGYGFIDKTGQVVINPEFKRAENFTDGLARFSNSVGGFGFLNKKGEVQFHTRYPSVYPFTDGLAVIRDRNYAYGAIDKNGNTVISPMFEQAYPFSDSLAEVRLKEKWGYIDTKGAIIIEPKYEETRPFKEGLAAVKIGKKWGFIDKDGNMIIEPNDYEQTYYFSEGLCLILTKVQDTAGIWREYYGYINKKGEMVIEPKFSEAYSFRGGLAVVDTKDNGWSYINKKGELVFDGQTGQIRPDVSFFTYGLVNAVGRRFE